MSLLKKFLKAIMEDYYADFEEELKLNFEYFKAQEGQPL